MWAFSYSSRLQLLFELTEATVFNFGWLYQSSSINHYRACIVTSLHVSLKPRANGRKIVGCYMLYPFAHPVACCWMLLRVVAQSLKPVKLFSQQLPTYLLFRDRRSVSQQCWIRLHSSSNIVGATHAHYAWITKTYGLIPRCTAGPNIVGSCCIRLHTSTNTYATTPNIVGATILGFVAPVCTQPQNATPRKILELYISPYCIGDHFYLKQLQ